jgi:hypothetical protein
VSDAFTKPYAPLISDTPQWAALEQHVKVIEGTHLRVRARARLARSVCCGETQTQFPSVRACVARVPVHLLAFWLLL